MTNKEIKLKMGNKSPKSQTEIYEKMRRIGAAIARLNGNNTHSGNLSFRDPNEADIFYITSSGSQCAALIPQDIVPVKFSSVSWGDARGSTESTIHRRILQLPKVNSVIHAHYISATSTTFDTSEQQMFIEFLGKDEKGRDEFLFHPVDLFGAYAVGSVVVGSYFQPVGSAEMEERIPKYLTDKRMTLVRGHGPFVRGYSPEDAFYRLSNLELSAKLLTFLRRRGVNVLEILKEMRSRGLDNFFPAKPHLYNQNEYQVQEIDDQSVMDDFKQRLIYNYNNSIAGFATGSMSQKISASQMIYCPTSGVPEDFDFPLFKKSLKFEPNDSLDLTLHKLIYKYTHQNTCMITTSPLATAEGMAILAEKYGADVLLGKPVDISYTKTEHPVVIPIDAEAIYLNPRLGLVDMQQIVNITPENPILNMLRWYKGCCVVAGYGVISTGETTLEQAAHNASSAERIAQFRSEVYINHKILGGPNISFFEP